MLRRIVLSFVSLLVATPSPAWSSLANPLAPTSSFSASRFCKFSRLSYLIHNKTKAVEEWDRADHIVIHRPPQQGEDCIAGNHFKPPALLVWSQQTQVLALDARLLEKETPRTLFARLQALRTVSADKEENADHSDDERGFRCSKPGCDRRFHHIHVVDKYKNREFDLNDEEEEDE